jgi:lysophospholipase L1-like esterase
MDRFQFRRDTSARWTEINPILLEGEIGVETDTKLRKMGDGTNTWNNLDYLAAENIVQELGDSETAVISQKVVSEELAKVYTVTPTEVKRVNDVVKELFVDFSGYTGSYSLDGARIRTIARGQNSAWGIAFENSNGEVLAGFWMSSELSIWEQTLNGIYCYVKYNWENMPVGATIEGGPYQLTPYTTSSAFDPRNKVTTNKIKDGAVVASKMPLYISRVFTKNDVINGVIRFLFIDYSNYSGSVTLDTIKIRTIARGLTGSWGLVLANSANEVLATYWMNSEISIYEATVNGIFMSVKYDWTAMTLGTSMSNIELTTEPFKVFNDPRNKEDYVTNDFIYGVVGDSVAFGAEADPIPDSESVFFPKNATATNKRKNYGYYITKRIGGSWYNYGVSGSTLADVTAAGIDRNGFAKANGRYTQMANDVNYITIMFGWNDAAYGNMMYKDEFCQTQFGNYYNNCTTEQKAICDSQSGEVGGVTYTGEEYWRRKYVGTINDNTNRTYFGAYNIVLDYLIQKYPFAKIGVMVPYGSDPYIRQAVRDIGLKWGVLVLDWYSADVPLIYQREVPNNTMLSSGQSLADFRMSKITPDTVHPTDNGYKYMSTIIEHFIKTL